jgi:hypothetical protein
VAFDLQFQLLSQTPTIFDSKPQNSLNLRQTIQQLEKIPRDLNSTQQTKSKRFELEENAGKRQGSK